MFSIICIFSADVQILTIIEQSTVIAFEVRSIFSQFNNIFFATLHSCMLRGFCSSVIKALLC